jgi:hypothetical protein
MNSAFARALGWRADELQAKPLVEFRHGCPAD